MIFLIFQSSYIFISSYTFKKIQKSQFVLFFQKYLTQELLFPPLSFFIIKIGTLYTHTHSYNTMDGLCDMPFMRMYMGLQLCSYVYVITVQYVLLHLCRHRRCHRYGYVIVHVMRTARKILFNRVIPG